MTLDWRLASMAMRLIIQTNTDQKKAATCVTRLCKPHKCQGKTT